MRNAADFSHVLRFTFYILSLAARVAMMETIFRIATSADIEIVVQFIHEYYEFDHLPFDEQVARVALTKFVGDESLGRVWLISYEDEAVGYLVLTLGYSLEYGGRDAFIDEVYIRASHRGRGIGQSALAFVEDVCRSLGVRVLHLEVERANTSAYGLYRKVGFVDHDRCLMTKRIST
ncbi:MAG TPA: GNAT family N-acetyltransferase, partial [Candidatus Binatia bacterium]|nr:GNAT family N-acetyltransferase [Candidatus Binatia bacterium]